MIHCLHGKIESHRLAAAQYDTLITKVKFEQISPNEGKKFFDKLEKDILNIKSKCNYYVPNAILDKWMKVEEH